MENAFPNNRGKIIVERLIKTIHENKVYLSELDGAIGDGDHGINMDKGFSLAEKEIEGRDFTMSESLKILGDVLLKEIGGSMGPLYGTMFRKMARASREAEMVDLSVLVSMLTAAREGVSSLGEALPGDKTLVDTLEPAVVSLAGAQKSGEDLASAVDLMVKAAENGWKSTENMVAKIGRAARLGERSRGVLDAGATSCYLLLESMGQGIKELIS